MKTILEALGVQITAGHTWRLTRGGILLGTWDAPEPALKTIVSTGTDQPGEPAFELTQNGVVQWRGYVRLDPDRGSIALIDEYIGPAWYS